MKGRIIYFEKFWYCLVYALALFPILPRGVESTLVIILFITSSILYSIKTKNKVISKSEGFKIIPLSIIFILYVIGTSYSENLKEALKFIVRSLPFISFPLIFGLFNRVKFGNNETEKLLLTYCGSVLIGLIYTHFSLSNFNNLEAWDYRQVFEQFTKVHGNYASLWIGFAALIVLNRIIKAFYFKRIYEILILSITLLYFIYWQMELGARIPLITTFILLFGTILLKFNTKKKVLLVIIISFISSLILITFLKPNYISRIKELTFYDSSLPEGDYHIKQSKITNIQIRNGIYYCSIELIKKHWIFGLGIGDVNDNLQECYENQINSNVYQVFKFNSHNQFLHFLLSSGILGLILFIFSLLMPIYLAYKSSNYLFMLFSILIFVSLFTENVFNRHDGIIFYSFFNSIFVFLSRDYKNK